MQGVSWGGGVNYSKKLTTGYVNGAILSALCYICATLYTLQNTLSHAILLSSPEPHEMGVMIPI